MTTWLIGIGQFLGEFGGGVLEYRDAIAGEGVDKVGAVEPGNFGGFFLGDFTQFVPFDGSGDAHFLDKFVRGFAQGRKDGVGKFDLDGVHSGGSVEVVLA